MQILRIIILALLLISPLNGWSFMVTPAHERPGLIPPVAEDDARTWTTGVMTKITNTSVVISGREYRLSRDSVIRYPNGKVIKNTKKTFNATNSANVKAVISGSTVEEIVIEGIELRN